MKSKILSFFMVILIISLIIFNCTGNTGGDDYTSASDELLLEDEYYLGKAVSSVILNDYPYLNNKEVQTYLRLVGATISAVSDAYDDIYTNYSFAMIDTDGIVAYAAPKGFIIVSKGLMKACSNEDEFAGIIALMIGLNIGNYPIEALPKEYKQKMNYAMDKEDAELLSNTFLEAVYYIYDIMVHGYPTDEIYFADDEAVRMLSEVGYSINAYSSILQKLSADGPPPTNAFNYNIEGRDEVINSSIDEYGPSIDIDPSRTERFLDMLAKLD